MATNEAATFGSFSLEAAPDITLALPDSEQVRTLTAEVDALTDRLGHLTANDAHAASDEGLADAVKALKRLEDATENARKHVVQPVLDKRMRVGQKVGDLKRVRSSRRSISDEEGARAFCDRHGIDQAKVTRVRAVAFAVAVKEAGVSDEAEEFIEENTYTYYRR